MAVDKFRPFQSEGPEDAPIEILARVEWPNASYNRVPIVTGDVSSIAYKVFDETSGDQTGSGSLDNSSVLAALNTGTEWTGRVDATGFNFVGAFPATCFPDGGRRYVVEVTINLNGGKKAVLIHRHTTAALRGS